MSLRDQLGLDGSPRPSDPESLKRALRTQLRRVQPGLAFWLDLLDRARWGRRPRPKP